MEYNEFQRCQQTHGIADGEINSRVINTHGAAIGKVPSSERRAPRTVGAESDRVQQVTRAFYWSALILKIYIWMIT